MTAEYPGNENNQKIISDTHDSERNLRYILTYNKWDSIIWGGSQFYIHIDRRCNDKYDQRREKDRISNYIGSKISISTVETGYLPDIDETLSTGKGICFDYAALMTAMLRSRDIPCKLQIGYAGDIKHAWIDVYIRGKGWVEQAITYDGEKWNRMDPTFTANSEDEELINSYIGDSANYTLQFTR